MLTITFVKRRHLPSTLGYSTLREMCNVLQSRTCCSEPILQDSPNLRIGHLAWICHWKPPNLHSHLFLEFLRDEQLILFNFRFSTRYYYYRTEPTKNDFLSIYGIPCFGIRFRLLARMVVVYKLRVFREIRRSKSYGGGNNGVPVTPIPS